MKQPRRPTKEELLAAEGGRVPDIMELRAERQRLLEQVQGADGVERRQRRGHERKLMTVLGPVTIRRTGCGARGSTSLHPMDEQLNLPLELYSYEVRKRVVLPEPPFVGVYSKRLGAPPSLFGRVIVR